jgi:hypothetical protein
MKQTYAILAISSWGGVKLKFNVLATSLEIMVSNRSERWVFVGPSDVGNS